MARSIAAGGRTALLVVLRNLSCPRFVQQSVDWLHNPRIALRAVRSYIPTAAFFVAPYTRPLVCQALWKDHATSLICGKLPLLATPGTIRDVPLHCSTPGDQKSSNFASQEFRYSAIKLRIIIVRLVGIHIWPIHGLASQSTRIHSLCSAIHGLSRSELWGAYNIISHGPLRTHACLHTYTLTNLFHFLIFCIGWLWWGWLRQG